MLPELQDIQTKDAIIQEFKGLNQKDFSSDDEYIDMLNMTSDEYPYLAPRDSYTTRQYTKAEFHTAGTCVFDNDIYTVQYAVNSTTHTVSGAYLFKNMDKVLINNAPVELDTNANERQMVKFGAYVVIYPDNVMYNTKENTITNMEYVLDKSTATLIYASDAKGIPYLCDEVTSIQYTPSGQQTQSIPGMTNNLTTFGTEQRNTKMADARMELFLKASTLNWNSLAPSFLENNPLIVEYSDETKSYLNANLVLINHEWLKYATNLTSYNCFVMTKNNDGTPIIEQYTASQAMFTPVELYATVVLPKTQDLIDSVKQGDFVKLEPYFSNGEKNSIKAWNDLVEKLGKRVKVVDIIYDDKSTDVGIVFSCPEILQILRESAGRIRFGASTYLASPDTSDVTASGCLLFRPDIYLNKPYVDITSISLTDFDIANIPQMMSGHEPTGGTGFQAYSKFFRNEDTYWIDNRSTYQEFAFYMQNASKTYGSGGWQVYQVKIHYENENYPGASLWFRSNNVNSSGGVVNASYTNTPISNENGVATYDFGGAYGTGFLIRFKKSTDGEPLKISWIEILYRYNGIGTKLKVSKDVPDMDYITVSANRIWGCSSDNHEIYACKQGDATSWYNYGGLASDSYAVTIASEGDFTGAITYNEMPYFFKENICYGIYGNKPSNYQVQQFKCRGVENGAYRTLTQKDGYVYYKSKLGVERFNGNNSALLTENLELKGYRGECGNICEDKLFMCLNKDARKCYVYDIKKNMWHIEEDTPRDNRGFMVNIGGNLYLIYGIEGNINVRKIYGRSSEDSAWLTTPTKDIPEWYVVSGEFNANSMLNKYVERFLFELKLEEGAQVEISFSYNNSDEWEKVYKTKNHQQKKLIKVPIVPKRLERMRYKIAGKGRAKIYSILMTIEGGSENG